jgi:hypothetical protein
MVARKLWLDAYPHEWDRVLPLAGGGLCMTLVSVNHLR